MSSSEENDNHQKPYAFDPEVHEVDPEALKTEHEKKVEEQGQPKDKEESGTTKKDLLIMSLTAVLLLVIGFSIWGVRAIYKDRMTFEVTSSGPEGNVKVFECPVSQEEQLKRLNPDIEEETVSQKREEVKQLGQELQELQQRLDSTDVDRSSEQEVKAYNQLLDAYHQKKDTYSQQKEEFEDIRQTYNKDVRAYNAFLENECEIKQTKEQ